MEEIGLNMLRNNRNYTRLITSVIIVFYILSGSGLYLNADEKTPTLSVFEIMVEYKKFFSKYVLVRGIRAEIVEDEFVLEAFPDEARKMKMYARSKDWKPEDLFINVRIDDRDLMKDLKKTQENSAILLLIEIRESAVYDRILPIFILHDFKTIDAPTAANVSNDVTEVTVETKPSATQQAKTGDTGKNPEPVQHKIRIKRR